MSCNGCRVLRKGCSESCVLRPCLQWIDTAEAQGHATLFVAKFFGRAGLMSFISAVHDNRRSALFQSLLYEACGRTINPVNGAVGLLWTGNWHLCQAAVDAVLHGGAPRRLPDLGAVAGVFDPVRPSKRRRSDHDRYTEERTPACDLDLCLSPMTSEGGHVEVPCRRRRPSTPSMNSEGSVTTSGERATAVEQLRVLNLFV